MTTGYLEKLKAEMEERLGCVIEVVGIGRGQTMQVAPRKVA